MQKLDMIGFWKAVAEHYKKQRNKAEDALGIAVDLVRAILDSELDGSGINSLQEFAQEKAKQLQTILEPL